jgi:hypothetical protein
MEEGRVRSGPRRLIPRQSGFLENGTKVVTGSRNGDVCVYDRVGGHPVFVLPHGDNAPAETIDVSNTYFKHPEFTLTLVSL